MIIYENNSVQVSVKRESSDEATVRFNDYTLIWISREEQEEFIKEFKDLMDKYRI